MTKEDLEILIYTSTEKDLLNFFQEKFGLGKPLSDYKDSQSLIYELDIECLEYAIGRLTTIESKYDERRLKLEHMRLNINKKKLEIEELTEEDKPFEITIVNKGDDSDYTSKSSF